MNSDRAPASKLARFVPTSVLESSVGNLRPPTEAIHNRFPAALLFADISGFTALSERLAGRGERGVEDLTRVLNAYFGHLIEIIHAHGGDVVKFAGDALLAVWRASDQPALASRVQAAAQCALAARDALRGFALEDGGTLALRLGIGAGETDAATIGGILGRWEYVVYGPALNEVTHAATRAEPDNVIAGVHAWAFLRDRFAGIEDTEGTRVDTAHEPYVATALVIPELIDDVAERLLAYIPAGIHPRLAAGQSAWLGEMRRITVLFVNLPDVRADTPVETMQRAMCSLQDGLYRFEGSVNKLSIDEKGVTLVAAFGLPPFAHEDDAERGVRAALELRTRLDKLGWGGSIGITSGRVFCGTIGSERRCEYTIIGDVVNLSARLMQAARGGILCDDATRKASAARLRFETLEPILVKGKALAIPIFRPLGEALPQLRRFDRQPMIGRVREQRVVHDRLALLATTAVGGVIVIEGEAGIGKSRFVAGVIEMAESHGLRARVAAADAIERSTSYFAWRGVFRELLGIDNPAQVADAVERALAFDPAMRKLAPLLGVVLGENLADNDTTAHMTQEARITSTSELLVKLLAHAAAEQSSVVVIEDCHWLDSASWALARQVSQAITPLLLLVVTRPLAHPLPRQFMQFMADPGTTHLVLDPLGSDDSLALVCRRLGVRSIPTAVADPIRAKAQGHPFYLEELAFALRDSGVITVIDGECVVVPGSDLSSQQFPDTVQGVVISRIDRLTPRIQLTLKVASVIGRTFSCRVLSEVFPMEGQSQALAQDLDTLVKSNLTVPDEPDPDPTQIFRHMITQEVAYNLMPSTQRCALHRAVAAWYEDTHRDNLATYYPLLARHWSSADDLPKAIDYLEKAAEEALRNFANEEVIRFLEQALSLSRRVPDQVDDFRRACWHRQLGEASYSLSDLVGSLGYFRETLRLLRQPMYGGVTAGIGCAWEIFRQFWRRSFPVAILPDGRAAHRALEAARVYERLAEICYLDNQKPRGIYAALKSLNLAEKVGPCPELARAHANVAVVSGVLGMHAEARRHVRIARETAERVDQPACTAYVDFIRSIYWAAVGAWADAEKDASNACRIAAEIGERRRWMESNFSLLNALVRKGEFERSLTHSQELVAVSRRHGSAQGIVWGLSRSLWSHGMVRTEQPEDALGFELAALLESESGLLDADRILGHATLAWVFWRQGNLAEASRFAARALEMSVRTHPVAQFLETPITALGEFYFEHGISLPAGDPARVECIAALDHLAGRLARFHMMYPSCAMTHALHHGRLLLLQGKPAAARRAWQRGIHAEGKIARPYDEGLLHCALARQLPPGDSAATTHAAEARRLFESVGAHGALARVGVC